MAQRVAVAVFCTIADGEDELVAEMAVRQALGPVGSMPLGKPIELRLELRDGTDIPITVHSVMEVGRAMANGRFIVSPSASGVDPG